MIVQHLGKDMMEKSVVNNFEQIVVGILLTLRETNPKLVIDDAIAKTMIENDPDPNPPYFSTAVITVTLDYITKNHSTGGNTLVTLLATKQDGIQKVLLALSVLLKYTPCPHETWRLLLVYRLFVHLTLKEFDTTLNGASAFVLRDVVNSLLHCLKDISRAPRCVPSECVALVTLELLKSVVVTAVECCHVQLLRILPDIISTVVFLSNMGGSAEMKCYEVINVIYVDSGAKLHKSLAILDPLPYKEGFASARAVATKLRVKKVEGTVIDDIEQFLETRSFLLTNLGGGRLEGLRQLKSRLMAGRQHLTRLTTTKSRVDENEYLMTILVRALVVLVRSLDQSEALEATECLGLVGLVDLRVSASGQNQFAVVSSKNFTRECFARDGREPTMVVNWDIIHTLDEYITDSK